ncbi:MAG: hypothetical protein OK454_03645 [Thaumarchaeota archaeon]|nr:hypothetical protein [Nitrososphaerota archaeon]
MCERLASVKEESQKLGEFIEWVRNERTPHLVLCQEIQGEYAPAGVRTEDLLAEYFDIDLQELEKERRSMLEELRERHQKEGTS